MPKVTVSLPSDLLTDLDREAAWRELEQQDPQELDAALDRARVAMRAAGSLDATGLMRAERGR
ncbi:hypothetical protein SAMN05661080_00991 [Modestobacter sp. DSM 44400]|uniref:hypothetical protein n=1 Tax=Modestobacter sp. DSM 44400 TaxID=1550230 RepID=UPI00089A5DF2|nr:hypothetical protein [Modestobacter sp. DSM 44400]SDX72705.1 hypothetical protein SAMN05661080_00991 [Modestobacter sp. DSM 44400]